MSDTTEPPAIRVSVTSHRGVPGAEVSGELVDPEKTKGLVERRAGKKRNLSVSLFILFGGGFGDGHSKKGIAYCHYC